MILNAGIGTFNHQNIVETRMTHGEGRQRAVYYTSSQSFIITFSNSLA